MKRTRLKVELWKLIPPSVDHIDEVFYATGYADGGSVKVEFRVGTRIHTLWVQAVRRRERFGYEYWYTGRFFLNGWLLDKRVKTLENLKQAILDYLETGIDEEARQAENHYRLQGEFPKSLSGSTCIFLRSVPDDLEAAKHPGCIQKQKALTKAERAAELERLRTSFGTDCLKENDAS